MGLLTVHGDGGRSLNSKMWNVIIPQVLSFKSNTMIITYLRELTLKHNYKICLLVVIVFTSPASFLVVVECAIWMVIKAMTFDERLSTFGNSSAY